MNAVAYYVQCKNRLATDRIHAMAKRWARWAGAIFLRDVLPTFLILIAVGWISLQVASRISETKDNHRSGPVNVATHP